MITVFCLVRVVVLEWRRANSTLKKVVVSYQPLKILNFLFFALTATISIFVSLPSSIVTILWSHRKSLDAFALLVSPRPSAIHFTPKFSVHLKPYRGSPRSRCSSSAHRWSTSTGAWVLACGRGAHSSRAHGQGAEAAG
jgi:hypothetical protein